MAQPDRKGMLDRLVMMEQPAPLVPKVMLGRKGLKVLKAQSVPPDSKVRKVMSVRLDHKDPWVRKVVSVLSARLVHKAMLELQARLVQMVQRVQPGHKAFRVLD